MKRVLLLIANVVAVVVAAEQAGSKDRPATDSFLLVVAVLIGKRMSFSFSFFYGGKQNGLPDSSLKTDTFTLPYPHPGFSAF